MRLRNDKPEVGNQPATELIFGEWYPAMRADRLRAGAMETTLLLGVPLLLGAQAGWIDLCHA